MAAAALRGPHVDLAGLSPIVAMIAGALVVLLVGLSRSPVIRRTVVPALTQATLVAALGLSVWRWGHPASLLAESLRVDNLSLGLGALSIVAGIACVLLSLRSVAPAAAGEGEYHALLLSTIAGMLVLVQAQNLVTVFLGFELLSIPLYVLCATELRRATSLESGLKYLIVGSLGSATLLYGLALIYGATGSTDFSGAAAAISRSSSLVSDSLLLAGIALTLAGLAFKCSVAPFHQWTPDVYEGAPTPITAFQAVATKAAAFAVLLRLFDVVLVEAQASWAPIMAVLAAVTIVVGNVGALGQSSLKRLLAYSSVAQAGYILGGVIVGTRLGLQATAFYLAVYLLMNLAAFAVIVARERETTEGDDIASLAGLGAGRPWLAWPMTLAMLGLAGIPATAGFVGKTYLIEALVDGGYAWLAIVLVVGSMISLAYYLRVVATMWMRPAEAGTGAQGAGLAGARPAMAGGSAQAAGEGAIPAQPFAGTPTDDVGEAAVPAQPFAGTPADAVGPAGVEVLVVAVAFGAATLFFGIVPSPLFALAHDIGAAVSGLL